MHVLLCVFQHAKTRFTGWLRYACPRCICCSILPGNVPPLLLPHRVDYAVMATAILYLCAVFAEPLFFYIHFPLLFPYFFCVLFCASDGGDSCSVDIVVVRHIQTGNTQFVSLRIGNGMEVPYTIVFCTMDRTNSTPNPNPFKLYRSVPPDDVTVMKWSKKHNTAHLCGTGARAA